MRDFPAGHGGDLDEMAGCLRPRRQAHEQDVAERIR